MRWSEIESRVSDGGGASLFGALFGALLDWYWGELGVRVCGWVGLGSGCFGYRRQNHPLIIASSKGFGHNRRGTGQKEIGDDPPTFDAA